MKPFLVPLLLLSLSLAACTEMIRPDFKRLYQMSERNTEQPPVIVVPGLFGSKLRDRGTGEEVWPGSAFNIVFSNYESIGLEIDPDTLLLKPSSLEAYAITEGALGRDFYGEIIKTLSRYGGYTRGEPGVPVKTKGPRYYLFPYDWRQDNVQTASQLDRLIEQIRRDYNDPALKVDIIAHSMGGLVVRYYLRYGTADVLGGNDFPTNHQGAQRVRRFIMLGTPNLGSVSSLHSLLKGYQVGLGSIPTEVLATMPSVYQLFPHPITDWLITAKGEPLDRDLFDREIWQRFEWSVFDPKVIRRIKSRFANPEQGEKYVTTLQHYFEKNLERARRFVWSLSIRVDDVPIRYVVFGGDCELTPARLLVEEVNGESVIRLYPSEISKPLPGVPYDTLMLEPGDGRVTKPSLLGRDALNPAVPRHDYSFFPLAFSFSLCETHERLTGNTNFQDNLLNVLLTHSRDTQFQ